MAQDVVGDSKLLERVNPTRRKRKVDRPPANKIARARVGPPLVKLDLVSASPEAGCQQSSGESAANESEFWIQAEKARTKFAKDTT